VVVLGHIVVIAQDLATYHIIRSLERYLWAGFSRIILVSQHVTDKSCRCPEKEADLDRNFYMHSHKMQALCRHEMYLCGDLRIAQRLLRKMTKTVNSE